MLLFDENLEKIQKQYNFLHKDIISVNKSEDFMKIRKISDISGKNPEKIWINPEKNPEKFPENKIIISPKRSKPSILSRNMLKTAYT